MPKIQSGINADANTDATFLTLLASYNDKSLTQIRQALAKTDEMVTTLQNRYPDSHLSAVVAVGAHAWQHIYPNIKSKYLHPFPHLEQNNRVAPSTAGDILVHIRSDRKDINFILSRTIMSAYADSVSLEEETQSFRYLDSRDLTGFVDGTENPQTEHRPQVTLTNDEQSELNGGSYIHLQRYVHHINTWEQLSIGQQEQIIGRTKVDNIEFLSEQKPPTAHIKRVSIKDHNGKSLEIMRHSLPYGNTQECGLQFISYAKRPDIFETMLKKMIEADEHGHFDHLLNHTHAVTGCAFFAPSIDFMQANN